MELLASDRIARAFNRSRATRVVVLDMSKTLDRFWHAFAFLKLKTYGSRLSSVIDCFEWFWMRGFCKNDQLVLEFLKHSFLVLHFSCYTLTALLMMLSVTVKGQKTVLNDIKFCLLYSISQESYMIWLSFMVHIWNMTICSDAFFIFLKILIFWVDRGVKRAKNVPE